MLGHQAPWGPCKVQAVQVARGTEGPSVSSRGLSGGTRVVSKAGPPLGMHGLGPFPSSTQRGGEAQTRRPSHSALLPWHRPEGLPLLDGAAHRRPRPPHTPARPQAPGWCSTVLPGCWVWEHPRDPGGIVPVLPGPWPQPSLYRRRQPAPLPPQPPVHLLRLP